MKVHVRGSKEIIQRIMRNAILCGTILALAAWVTSAALGQSLTIEAESGIINAPFAITNGYIYQPLQTGITNGGRAVYNFTITNAGKYAIMASVNTPNASSNSFFVRIDGEPQDPASVWEFPAKTGFTERIVTCRETAQPSRYTTYTLSEGVHKLIIQGRGADAQLDRLAIVRVPESPPAPPGKLRIVTDP
jgi:hypothetical protein